MKPLATVHTSDPVTVLHIRRTCLRWTGSYSLPDSGSQFIIPRFLFTNASPCLLPIFLKNFKLFFFGEAVLWRYDSSWLLRFESFPPEEFQVLETFFEGFYVVCLHLYSLHTPDSWFSSSACSSEVEGALLTRTDWEECVSDWSRLASPSKCPWDMENARSGIGEG